MKYYLYILETINNTLYCGITSDIKKRYKTHLEGKGAKYTKANRPKRVVLAKEFENKSLALKEEYRIKKTLNRNEKIELIKSNKIQTQKILNNLYSINVQDSIL